MVARQQFPNLPKNWLCLGATDEVNLMDTIFRCIILNLEGHPTQEII